MLSEPLKIRVRFSKTGSLKFISHLDLNRTVKSAFLRSGLPIWWTQGFNPHPKTVFSLPLSVGTASLCEFMDLRITEEVAGEEICRKLNEAFPAGLRVLDAYEPQTKFDEIKWADYEICLQIADPEGAVSRVRGALTGEMPVEKTGKAGTYTIDIAPLTKVRDVFVRDGELVLLLTLSCDEMAFVNPRLVLDVLEARTGLPAETDDYAVCRTEVYLADGKTYFR